jgi:hypothetical protein
MNPIPVVVLPEVHEFAFKLLSIPEKDVINDAPRELAHDHEHPVGLEQNGLATKKINAPETVLRVSDESQP